MLRQRRSYYPANIRLDEDVLKTSFVSVFRRRLQKTSSEDVFKTSSRPIYSSCHMSSRSLQDVFKTSSRRFEDVFKTSSKRLQDIFKASSRRLQHVSKTSSRCLQDIFKTSCKDIFKTFSRRTIKLICSS